jgi:hypothetical protein
MASLRKINLLVISDAHGKVEYIDLILATEKRESSVDAIIFCGDIAPYRNPYKTKELLIQLTETVKKYGIQKVFAVPGNIDIESHYNEVEDLHDVFVNLHERGYLFQGYYLAGLGGSTITPFNSLLEYAENVIEQKLEKVLSSLPPGTKAIIVTHVPPFNTQCDKAYTGEHIGSKALRKVIEEYKPLLALSGHVHESRCVERVEETLVVNPGPVSRGYYAVVSVSEKGVEAVLKNV